MKFFLVVVVLVGTLQLLATEVLGAPSSITSEQLGNVVQQIQRQMMLESEKENKLAGEQQHPREQYYVWEQQYHPRVQQHPREQQYPGYYAREQQRPHAKARTQGLEQASMQVQGVSIVNCGTAGNIINSALSVLNFLFPTEFGVLVNCAISPGCVQVRVDVPADDVLTDIDVCDLGNGEACVEVYVEPTSQCNAFGLIPIVIPIPIGTTGKSVNIDIRINPGIPFLGIDPCATVKVEAPKC